MSSTLQLIKYASGCNGGFLYKCWRLCHYSTKFVLNGNYAVFGPSQTNVDLSTEECNCDSFVIASAKVTTTSESAQAVGSSPNQTPFSQVVIRRSEPSTLSVTWTGGDSAPFSTSNSCTAYYSTTSGPTVLPIPQAYFTNWWTILIGCFMFFLLTCTVCVYCGYFSRVRERKSSLTRNLSGGPIRRPSGISSSTLHDSSSSSTQYSATLTKFSSKQSAIRSTPSSKNEKQDTPSNNVPRVTESIPVAVALPLDEEGRQIAIV